MKTKGNKKSVPRPDQPLLREKVRAVLSITSRRFAESMILDAVNRLIPIEADNSEIRQAMEWNHDRGFIDYVHNHDTDRDEWALTKRGKDKEGIR